MSFDDILDAVEELLPADRLGAIDRFIFRQSWLGRTYTEMAHMSGYGNDYIKEVGSRLWHDLSEVTGQRVTKKNLQLVFSDHLEPTLASIASVELAAEPVLSESASSAQHWQDLVVLQPPRTIDRVMLPLATRMGFPGGPIPLNSPFYIERPPIEWLSYAELEQPGSLIRIRAPRQMGKSSLMHRLLAHADMLEYRTVHLDFQEADQGVFSSLDQFLRWFCANISRRLQVAPRLDDYWDEDMGSKVSCKVYFAGYLLKQIERPIVIALNEVNRVFEHPQIAQDFLPMLRVWHEQAKHDPAWQKLRLVLAHSTEIYVPLNLNQSPFNVGLSIRLHPFNVEQVQELAQRYHLDWNTPIGCEHAAALQMLVGGHPYLVSLALYHLRQGDITIEQLLETAAMPSGIYAHHLRGLLTTLLQNPELIGPFQRVVAAGAGVSLEAIAAYKLESMGLVHLDGNVAKLSCELYRSFFQEQFAMHSVLQPVMNSMRDKEQW
jgi:hypothetical protein